MYLPDAAAGAGEGVTGCAVGRLSVRNASQHEAITDEQTRLCDDVDDSSDHRTANSLTAQRQIHRAVSTAQQRPGHQQHRHYSTLNRHYHLLKQSQPIPTLPLYLQ